MSWAGGSYLEERVPPKNGATKNILSNVPHIEMGPKLKATMQSPQYWYHSEVLVSISLEVRDYV